MTDMIAHGFVVGGSIEITSGANRASAVDPLGAPAGTILFAMPGFCNLVTEHHRFYPKFNDPLCHSFASFRHNSRAHTALLLTEPRSIPTKTSDGCVKWKGVENWLLTPLPPN